MSVKLEALRIMVAAQMIPAVGVTWNQQTLDQAGQFFVGMAMRIQAEEQAKRTPDAPKETPDGDAERADS